MEKIAVSWHSLGRRLEKKIKDLWCKKIKIDKKQRIMESHYCPLRAF